MTYYCTKCNYKHKKEKIPPRCPYCSAVGTLRKKETAQEILDSVIEEVERIDKNRKERGY